MTGDTENLVSTMAEKPRVPARVFGLIGADHVLSQSAFFSIMPMLPLMMTMKLDGSQEQFIAWAISVLTFMTRGGALFVTPLLHRLSVRTCVRLALTMLALAYTVVAITSNPWVLILALSAAGLGFSINGLGVRSFIILSTPDKASQNRGFAVIQIVANCAAALGPIFGSILLDSDLYSQFLFGVSVAFFAAAIFAPMTIPLGLKLNQGSRSPMMLGIIRELISTSELRRLTLTTMIGSILMGQFFSSFALVFSEVTDSPFIRGLFYTLNAVIVVMAQIPVSLVVERNLHRDVSVQKVLVIGVCILGTAMPFFEAWGGTLGMMLLLCGVIIFSFGEMVFAPIVNVAFANATGVRPVLEAINMRQITTAAGESVGAWMGISIYTAASDHDLGFIYWGALAVVAGVTLLTLNKKHSIQK